MEARAAHSQLYDLPPQPLNSLSSAYGIYALYDHEGQPRYIGSTWKDTFHKRIQNRHVTGSEENSHKFSWAYNIGRMWRDRRALDPLERKDGDAAKRLRTAFVRRHCQAACLSIELPKSELVALEKAIIALAEPAEKAWNDKRLVLSSVAEPVDLITRLIEDLALDPAAFDRQAVRFETRFSSAPLRI